MLIEFRTLDGQKLGPEGFDLGVLQAGQASEPFVFDITYRWDEGVVGDPLTDLFFRLPVEDPQRQGVGLSKGLAPADQLWFRVRVVGHNNDADPTQVPYLTDWTAVGAYRVLPIPSLHAGCSRRLELVSDTPGDAGGSHTLLPTVDYSEHSRALAAPVPVGIDAGLGDSSRSGLIRGGQVSASPVPDDQIQVAAHQVLDRGRLRGHGTSALTLDRIDGAGDALDDGANYLCRIVATSNGPAVRKASVGAAAPPAAADDVASLEVLRVTAPAGGGSPVITAVDLLEGRRFDRHRVEAGVGLELRVHTGQAYGPGTWRIWQRISDPIPLAPNAVQYLWQLRTGRYEITTTDAPPQPGALGPWAEVETDASAVIRLVDLRTYSQRVEVLTAATELGAAGVRHRWILPRPASVSSLSVSLDAAADVSMDLQVDGASALVAGTEPSFTAAGDVNHAAAIPTGEQYPAGTILELHASAPAPGVTAFWTLEWA